MKKSIRFTFLLILCLLCFINCRDKSPTVEELLSQYSMSYLYQRQQASIEDFLSLGYSYQEIFDNLRRDGNYYYEPIETDTFIQDFLELGISPQELIDGGITILQLYFHGVTTQQFIDDGIAFKDIIISTRRVTPLDFINLGYNAQRLIDEGIIIETTMTGFYVMNYMHQRTGPDGAFLLDQINGGLQIMNTWRVPTLSELQFIYDNRDAFGFEINLNLHQDDPDFLASPNFKYWLSSEFVDCTTAASVINRPRALNFVQNQQVVLCAVDAGSDYWIYLVPVIQM